MGKPRSKKADTTFEAPAAAAFMLAANPILGKAWFDLMSESARFMTKRLEADLEMQRAMLACKDPAEFIELQTKFVSTAATQYAEEASRFFQMTFNASGEITKDALSSHTSDYDDVPV